MPVVPSDDENEYFHKQEMERLRKARQDAAEKMAAGESEKLRELHYMHCPKCGMDLQEFDFRGLKLDRCGSCGGVWFDEGEMEQLLSQGNEMFDRLKNFFR
jgi:uncharacterized protein